MRLWGSGRVVVKEEPLRKRRRGEARTSRLYINNPESPGYSASRDHCSVRPIVDITGVLVAQNKSYSGKSPLPSTFSAPAGHSPVTSAANPLPITTLTPSHTPTKRPNISHDTMAPRTAKIVPPKYQNLVLGFEIGMLAYVSYELSRVYRGTHPHMSRKLAEHGIWPPPRLPAVKDDQGRGSEGAAGEKDDVRWMHINGLPVPVSFDALTGFWRR